MGLDAVLIAISATIIYAPKTSFPILLAALPVFDFAPWTGRFFFDEFDILLLTMVVAMTWQSFEKSRVIDSVRCPSY